MNNVIERATEIMVTAKGGRLGYVYPAAITCRSFTTQLSKRKPATIATT